MAEHNVPSGSKPAKITAKTKATVVATQYGDHLATETVEDPGTAPVSVRTGTYINKKDEETPYRIGSVTIDGLTINVANLPESVNDGDTVYGQVRLFKIKESSKTKKDKDGNLLPKEVVRFTLL